MKDYQGVIWMCVISLKRVDAACLGYDSNEQWRELIRSKRINFSKYMKIDSRNFRWYCTFHNECHLPQYHLMFYSTNGNGIFIKSLIWNKKIAYYLYNINFIKKNSAKDKLRFAGIRITASTNVETVVLLERKVQ